MFDYEVMTEQEAMKERYQLINDGTYEAVIDKAEARISANSGNPMMELNLTVYDETGKPHPMKDFLVFTKNMMWKTIHCANSAGLTQEYLDKKLSPELLQGSTVRVKVSSQEGSVIPDDKLKGKPAGSKYPDKNVIEDYINKEGNQALATSPVVENDPFNDTIPF